tara:strand:+ start:386 stop:925 length:540 start_codon:yes stop_codon:yes gene_type:complete
MNKIEFEDLLSKYIENDLSIADRKKIEAYLNDNKEARNLLSSTKKTLRLVNNLESINASEAFNQVLFHKLKKLKNRNISSTKHTKKRTYFGFTPRNGAFLSLLIVLFIGVSFNLVSNVLSDPINQNVTAKENLNDLNVNKLNDSSSSLVSAVKDSSKTKKSNRKTFDLKDKVQFVKDGD